MSLTLRTTLGFTEAVIDAAGGLKRFYEVASVLTDAFSVSFSRKEDDFDAITWAFRLNKYELTLEYNIYNGILLFPTKGSGASKRDNEAVVQLANVLEGKLMNLGLQNKLV
ncbi:MAG: hypothetical protein EOO14_17725 [Chitinophagaceae bacterium]|nr:hypothetical protein [Flavisolibacter longurius]RYZ51678.1 MAG: hypothetical protein EOO14_17725 [Chitinophagaceae bacterium]